MLDLRGHAAQRIVAKPGGFPPEARGFIADRVSATAKPLDDLRQRRDDGVADVVGRLRDTRRRAAGGTLHASLKGLHAPLNVGNVSREYVDVW
jgi:hypothetical protein